MNLLNYIKSLSSKELDEFAMKCSTSSGNLKQIAYGNRRAGPSMAIKIDKHTDGKVSFLELRPDIDWQYVQEKILA